MKRALPLVLCPLLVLAGCGGTVGGDPEAGFKTQYLLSPAKATVEPGGTLDLVAEVVEGDAGGVSASVREGAEGGLVSGSGTTNYAALAYTAPAAPGTYHVDATFAGTTNASGTTAAHTASATITVAAR